MFPDSIGWTQKDYVQLIKCAVAGRFEPEHWLAFATNESGLKPKAKNPYAPAKGLWQAMPSTLVNLGWRAGDPDFDAAGGEFTNLSIDAQVRWSQKYLDSWRKRYAFQAWKRSGDMYLCNFAPAHLPHRDVPEHKIFDYDTDPNTYWVNRGLDSFQAGITMRVLAPPPKYSTDHPYKGKGFINVRDMAIKTAQSTQVDAYKQAMRSLNKLVQAGLNARGEKLAVDGDVGPATQAALKRYWVGAGFPQEDQVLDAHTRLSLL